MKTGKKRMLGQRELIVSAISLSVIFIVLLFSLIILFDPALGWFAYNTATEARGMTIVSDLGDAEAQYECYVYNVRTSLVETQDLDDLNMQPYDMIFDKRNRYTPAIVQISLEEIAPQFADSGILEITIARDTTLPNNEMNAYFSSIMRFTAAVGNSYASSNPDTLYGNIDAALYQTVKQYPANYISASSKTFTTMTGGAGTDANPYTYLKSDTITLSVPYTSADKNGDVLNLYLYLTYDETLVRRYRAAEGIDTSSSMVGRTVTITDDIETITVSFS